MPINMQSYLSLYSFLNSFFSKIKRYIVKIIVGINNPKSKVDITFSKFELKFSKDKAADLK